MGQTCSIQNGSGTIAAAAVTNVAVTCSSNSYTVSGSITGLLGAGLVLQNNSASDQTPAAGATSFAFPAVAGTSPYLVAVATQPLNPSQTCSVANGSGTGTGGNVTNVAVTCATNSFAVNVNVTGLSGAGLVLRNNGGNNLAINADGAAAFSTQVQSGSAYAVSVFAQPASPTQTCTVGGNATGTVGNGPVTVNVTCSTFSGTIGGTVSGLSGTGLTLTNNAGNTLSISGNGAFHVHHPGGQRRHLRGGRGHAAHCPGADLHGRQRHGHRGFGEHHQRHGHLLHHHLHGGRLGGRTAGGARMSCCATTAAMTRR